MHKKALLAACLALSCSPFAAASANTVYKWEADCTLGCTGKATGSLVLSGNVSTDFGRADFVSFEYKSSSGEFLLLNDSPYLAAFAGGGTWALLFLEENAYGPNSLPLFQFGVGAGPEIGGEWQLLVGEYGWTCFNSECTNWTDNVIRNVGVNFLYTSDIGVPVAMPEPLTWVTMIAGFGLIGSLLRYRKRKTSATYAL